MNLDRLCGRLHGAITALATPFRNGEVDYEGLSRLVEWQVAQGIHGLVPCGTTGEAPTLNWQERTAIIGRCVEIVAGRVPIIAGTGSNATAATIEQTAMAADLGADAALIVTPYYNRPTQEGIVQHFAAIARAVSIPIIVYNVPARTGVDLAPQTIERLAAIPAIIGIKDATGDLSRPMAVSRLVGDRFIQLSGHDATALGFNMMGGSGTISVVANVAPSLCAQMHEACGKGHFQIARLAQHRLLPLISALERETNPIAVKHALHLLHGICPEARLPLTPATAETAHAVRLALQAFLRGGEEPCAASAHAFAAG
ncbi:MAG TPA: 4-hydroxy-tetrahydrodipicolinate synthase [Bosea sp. (in: a-proteobacteria)]|jgi:4-hydroxy-tetrahydrodipicolinate synthase|uniref:4-hydroxy-tetrahydrodipicolinate synthase n=1 Tax=Bosea sp. (in: a-proteobacteria) TaxID=1871050 RepID=UPI002E124D06|nr:4-hydroxy-tetrahydrodipicolinate synthase [Bosea sp. (in: a-proteobacteria)]